MGHMLRSIGAIIVGLAVGVVVVTGVEALSSTFYPLPPGVDPTDPEALKPYLAQFPLGAFLFVLAAWGLGSFLGAWLATRLGPGRHRAHGLSVGVLLLAAGVANMLMLPHPVWFWVAALVIFVLCPYLGAKLGGVPSPPGPQPAPAA